MIIEYSNSSFGVDVEMSIDISEFKEITSGDEYRLIEFVVESFCVASHVNYPFTTNDYSEIEKRLPLNGRIVFYIVEIDSFKYRPLRWCEVLAVSNNHISKIVYSPNQDGYLYMSDMV